MKVAILSDLHGNKDALDAVLREVRKRGITNLFILGDIVGYYYYPDAILSMLEDFDTQIILGNHEIILKNLLEGKVSDETIRKKYGSGVLAAIKNLSREKLNYLINLPESLNFKFNGISFQMFHGAPWDINCYVYPNSSKEIFERCTSKSEVDFLLLGHTHYPLSHFSNGVIILNPGSVGQPRDRIAGASWAIIDTENKDFSFMRTPYRIDSLLRDIQKFDPDVPFLADVLLRGANV